MWSLKTSGMEALAGYWALENPVADRLKPRFRVHLEFLLRIWGAGPPWAIMARSVMQASGLYRWRAGACRIDAASATSNSLKRVAAGAWQVCGISPWIHSWVAWPAVTQEANSSDDDRSLVAHYSGGASSQASD